MFIASKYVPRPERLERLPSLPRDSLALHPGSSRPTKVSPAGPNQRTQRVHEACCYGIQGVSKRGPECEKKIELKKKDKITRRTHRRRAGCLFFGLRGEGVLDAQHDVGAGAAAGRLLQEVAARERRRQARHRAVAHPPRFTVVVRLPVALFVGAVPDHLVRPGRSRGGAGSAVDSFCGAGGAGGGDSPRAVPQDVPAVEGVDGDVLRKGVGVFAEDGLPAVEQDLVLQEEDNGISGFHWMVLYIQI